MTTASLPFLRTAPMTGVRLLDPYRDFPDVVRLIELGFYEELDPQGLKMLMQMRRKARYGFWAQLFSDGPLNLEGFVWEEQGRIVGNLSLRRASPGWNQGRIIGNVVVHPDYRGRGIARALMEAAEQAARAEGARWIGLEVRTDNVAACTLYEHLGFRVVGEVAHLLRPGGLPWPAFPAPRPIWRRSEPEDKLLWVSMAEKTLTPLQAQVLEVRPALYTFGGFGRALELWFSRERERAWIHATSDPQLAVSVQTDLGRRFHVWELLALPVHDAERAQEATAQVLANMARRQCWPVVTFVPAHSALVPPLSAIGFTQHRLLAQMYRALDS